MPTRRALLALTASSLGLGGCAMHREGSADAEGWHDVRLPGKEQTLYRQTVLEGRRATAARSARSASMWRRKLAVPPTALGDVSFSWWVRDLIGNASVADVDREDSPARVLFAFGGDVSRLPRRTRAMFELAEALTGEAPPFATLMYVWEAQAPLESVIVNPRSDRIRKIVVDSGSSQLRRWRDHRRNLVADFQRAFGEAPGPLTSVALMTDSDNTSSTAEAYYGPVKLL
jgi:hypothetical protein